MRHRSMITFYTGLPSGDAPGFIMALIRALISCCHQLIANLDKIAFLSNYNCDK